MTALTVGLLRVLTVGLPAVLTVGLDAANTKEEASVEDKVDTLRAVLPIHQATIRADSSFREL